MPKRIIMSTEIDQVKQEMRFIIKIPLNLINNSNFFETMRSLEFGNPSTWLRRLADAIDEVTKGNDNA